MRRIAIIGCGLIGETHAGCLAELGSPPLLFADVDRGRAEHLASRYSGKAVSDPIAAIQSPEIEAVYICTHHDTHAPLAIAAAQAGKHIFLEKPMALTERECRELVAAVQDLSPIPPLGKGRGICMTGFKLHYASLARKARELVKHPLVLSAQVMEQRWPDDSWANDPLRGGGNVLSQGCHATQMLLSLVGSRPIRIFAEGGNFHHPKLDIIDTLAATISFENGAVATLLIGDAGEMPHDGKFNVQAMDGKKTIHLFDRLTSLSYFDGEHEDVFHAEEDGFMNEDREFLAAITEGRKPETDEIDGLRAQMLLLRGVESIRTGLPQTLTDLP